LKSQCPKGRIAVEGGAPFAAIFFILYIEVWIVIETALHPIQ